MNIDKINELLERYYNAQTTEAEEEELKRFFLEGEVPPQLANEKEMFLQYIFHKQWSALQKHSSPQSSRVTLYKSRRNLSIDNFNFCPISQYSYFFPTAD